MNVAAGFGRGRAEASPDDVAGRGREGVRDAAEAPESARLGGQSVYESHGVVCMAGAGFLPAPSARLSARCCRQMQFYEKIFE